MLNTILTALFVICITVLLLLPGAAILVGVTNKHVIKPIMEKINDPGPLYVDDRRCCR